MVILGLSAYFHDSAASLIRDGNIIAAAQEERFTRKSMTQIFLIKRSGTVLKRLV
jgi:carbamoyltransferase